MAEILGAVASGFAVAEVGLKVGGTVWKLKKLWEEVHEVPATIQDLMRQIEIMDPILCDHESALGNQSIALPTQLPTRNTAPAMLSAAYCREALNDLRRLVEDLDVAIESEKKSRRNFARMRVVLKKDTIRGFQDRLERAMRLFQSTQLSYLAVNSTITAAKVTDLGIAVLDMQAQLQLLSQQLDNRNLSNPIGKPPFPVVTQHFKTSPESFLVKQERLQPQGNGISIPWSGPSIFGALVVKNSEAHSSGEASYAVRFQLPKWLSQKVWDIGVKQACSGWQWNFSTWNIVPKDSPGLECIVRGDLDGWIDLYNRGLASPKDCSVSGTTSLGLACTFSQTHIIKHFLDMNLDIAYITSTQPRTILDITRNLPVDMILSLVGRGCLEPINHTVEDFENLWANMTTTHWVSMTVFTLVAPGREVFEVLLRTSFPFWRDYPPRRKHRIILNRLSFYEMTADSLRRLVICPYGPVRPIDAQIWIDDGASLLSLVFSYYLRNSSNPDTGNWDTLLEEAIKASDDMHHILDSPFIFFEFNNACSAFKSALLWSIFRFRGWKREDKTTTRHELRELTVNLQWMMSILASCGHNLLEFGRQEAAIWARKGKSDKIVGDTLYIGIKYDWVRYVRAIHYGAEPEDWYFELDYHYEDDVGAFWNLVENPHLYMMPGAWIDEE